MLSLKSKEYDHNFLENSGKHHNNSNNHHDLFIGAKIRFNKKDFDLF